MPIQIKDLDGGLGNLITGYGVLTGEEYKNTIKNHISQDAEKFKKYRYSLCDFTKVTSIGVCTDDIKYAVELCEEASEMNPNAVVAIIAENDVTFGMSRMWEMLFGDNNWEVMVFKAKGDAEEWIRAKVREKFGINDLSID